MNAPTPKEVTQLLLEWNSGDREAINKLMPLVYEELNKIARHYMRRERPDHTLQTSALINEAYLRLIDQQDVTWKNRAQFFAISARLMRQILVDHARSRNYAKRGGDKQKASLDEVGDLGQVRASYLISLDDALQTLAAIDSQQSSIIELRFFGGLSIEETAEALGISPATVKREWSLARAWLLHEMRK